MSHEWEAFLVWLIGKRTLSLCECWVLLPLNLLLILFNWLRYFANEFIPALLSVQRDPVETYKVLAFGTFLFPRPLLANSSYNNVSSQFWELMGLCQDSPPFYYIPATIWRWWDEEFPTHLSPVSDLHCLTFSAQCHCLTHSSAFGCFK